MSNLVSSTNSGLNPTVYVMSDSQFAGNYYDEGDLDVELSQALVYPQTLWYYALNNDDVFLDAVDASYCSVIAAGPNCGTTPLAKVMYGYSPENDFQIRDLIANV